MNVTILSLVLVLAQPSTDPGLARVPLNDATLAALRASRARPVVLFSDAVIIEVTESERARLFDDGIDCRVLLAPPAYAAARATGACYVVTPPPGTKSAVERRELEAFGTVLAEDGYSYLFLTDSLFLRSSLSLRYELMAVEFEPVVLPAELGVAPPPRGSALLARHFVIDTILGRITTAEIMQLMRKFTGEESTTVRGVRDTITSRWTMGRKNSSAVWWLHEKLQGYGMDSVAMDSFTFRYPSGGPYYTDSNVIATEVGRVYPTRYWIIGGHLDSRGDSSVQRPDFPAPGADDNASGVIAALLAAKYMKPFPFRYTVRYIGWNGEEQGLYGSVRHATRARARGDTIMGVFNADMIATDTAGYDSIVIYRGTRPGAVAIGDTFFSCNQVYGTGLKIRRSSAMSANSDHYSYFAQNYDAVHIIEDGLTPYYHQQADRVTAPTFDSIYFTRAVKAAVATIATLAEPDTNVYDVAVNRVLSPTGDVDSGQTVVPVAEVENLGPTTAAFTVTMRIGGGYTQTRGKVLSSGQSDTVGFTAWDAQARGEFAVVCTVAMAGDVQPGNNRVMDTVNVRVRDVGCARIVMPTGTVDSGASVVPACTVRNYGNTTEDYDVRMKVGSTYDRVVAVGGHVPGTAVYVTFPAWDVGVPRGRYAVRCSSELAADMALANDWRADSVAVGVEDAAVVAIVAPADTIPPGDMVPQAALRNNGTSRQPVNATLTIVGAAPPYQATTVLAGLPVGLDTTISFPVWNARVGSYVARCSVYQAGDLVQANDTASMPFTVYTAVGPPGWVERAPMPAPPSTKQVKDGGWLAEDGDYIYAAKGNKTPDFYRYDVENDSWQTLAPIPNGREGKVPGKGAVGCAAGDIYAVKGNNTQGFWRYDAGLDSWYQMADIPLGVTNKKVKGGTDIVHINNQGQNPDYLYLLKGGKNEFWRYDIEGDSWTAMPDAPTGSSGKDKYDKGSWLVDRRLPRQGPRVIYAHRAKYHELFVFDTETEAWQPGQLGGMPYIGSTGKSKKSKDGGSAASFGDYIYALKGGNTQEFWKYHVELDSWSEADPMPLLGSTGKAKKVKAGADIVGVHDYLFALKGNKTLELWRYTPALYALRPTLYARRGVQSGVMRDASGVMRLSSNPVRAGFVTLRLSGPVAQWSGGPVMVSILDVSGRALQTATCYLQMETSFDLRKLSAGVYLLVLQYDDKTAIQKFVLQR